MNSCLYVGSVRHRRFAPRPNRFHYRLFMAFIDLAELPHAFDSLWLWSARHAAPARFRRADYYGDPSRPLDVCVRELVEQHVGVRPEGPIRLLTHLRYFGHNFNPVSFYYVYDASGARVDYVVAEITNTPWRQRHTYVLPTDAGERRVAGHGGDVWRWQFDKDFHVSPFLPMDMHYDWRFCAPAEALYVHMQTRHAGQLMLDATLNLRRRALTRTSALGALLRFPLMTLKVSALIYWQALKLALRRTPFFAHPGSLSR
ncbi:hypothetical protein HNQ60_001248 [Povalibacter uvarum]|uniref:DUF1365 domain-containing protein n=1 Tax=Povalibacter uvarum TaxID=732238 RepID=A0A841HJS5_9GAMM|nr:DUF1365 domain-containing protein [Povalibacter uvarum]MBB6092402.1 hypothetical protein [Povalibacter uvarum]